MSAQVSHLMLASLLVALIGLFFASQATLGVALVGCACLLAMYARLVQADDHARRTAHDETPTPAPAAVPAPAK